MGVFGLFASTMGTNLLNTTILLKIMKIPELFLAYLWIVGFLSFVVGVAIIASLYFTEVFLDE